MFDDKPGIEVCSRETLFTMMQVYLDTRRVSPQDGKAMHPIIMATTLPIKQKDVEPDIDKIVSDWNARRYANQQNKGDDTAFYDTSKIHPKQ